MKWLFKPSTLFLGLIICLFVFETPRGKLLGLGDSFFGWMSDHNAKNRFSGLPSTLRPDALMGNFQGFVTAEGYQFSVSQNIRHWRNDDALSWSHQGGNKISVTNSRTGETVTATFIQVRQGYYGY